MTVRALLGLKPRALCQAVLPVFSGKPLLITLWNFRWVFGQEAPMYTEPCPKFWGQKTKNINGIENTVPTLQTFICSQNKTVQYRRGLEGFAFGKSLSLSIR